MNIIDKNIDGGKAFDWGKTSDDYAKFRDIYPTEFYKKIISRNLCINNQKVLDLGTGTGVIPRNMYSYGAKWTGIDISENQIKQAKILSKNLDIDYFSMSAEKIDFPENTFDVVTACQCFWYFNSKITAPKIHKILKPNGKLLVLYMAWLPFEDKIASASENLVLKYNPKWSGANEKMHPIIISEDYNEFFETVYHEEYKINVHFTKENWNGRMKACRGIGASLTDTQIKLWEKEHIALLNKIAPPEFDILHYVAISELKKK